MLELIKLLAAGKAPKQLYWVFGLGVACGVVCGAIIL